MHHGKILEQILEEKKILKKEYAQMLGMTAAAVSDRIKAEQFPKQYIEEAVKYLGVDKSVFGKVKKNSCEEALSQKEKEVSELLKQIVQLQSRLINTLDENSHLAMECQKLEHELKMIQGKNFVEAFHLLAADHPEIYRKAE